jgi:hypothetical protein
MTYMAHHEDFAYRVGDDPTVKYGEVVRRPGALRRIFDAVFPSREMQKDAEIADFLARSGGRLTDDLEREIMRRQTISNWSVHG